MADYDSFKLGAVTYPVPATPFVGALERLDPPLFAVLAYYVAMIRTHLGAYFDAAATAAGKADLVGKIVAESIAYDPLPHMVAANYKLPLLALYRTEEQSKERTLSWYSTEQKWSLLYILPPLDAAQTNALIHVLRGVRSVIIDRTCQGYDPSYKSGEEVFAACGIAEIGDIVVKYGRIPGLETNTYYPAIEMMIPVSEQESKTPGLLPFSAIDGVIDVANGNPDESLSMSELIWESV